MTDVAANKALVRRLYDEVVGRGDLALLNELASPDVVDRTPLFAMTPGIQGFRRHLASFRRAFGEPRVVVDELVAEGDRVVAVWSASGTHAGPFFSVPATGLPVTTTSVSVLRIAHGRIVEYAVHGDVYGVLQQLGSVTVEPVSGDSQRASCGD
jgi:steroid delta-isomerase-like uncharacterized protein